MGLAATTRSLFARIFTGSVGLDPYTTAVSDVYQDLFGTGTFTGKGIYEVDAFESAGVTKDDVDAYWLGTMGSGISGLTLSRPLKLDYKPVTRLENMCATGSEAFRNACYAVASGAYDVVMAVGGEKLKDSGYSGLVVPPASNDGTASEPSARPQARWVIQARRTGLIPISSVATVT